MTLSLQNRTRLAAICNDHRSDWEAALTTDGILKLDRAHPNDPLLVIALTVAAARNPAANGPAFMAGKQLEAAPVATRIVAAPRHDDPECDLHNGTIRDDMGRFVCCVQAEAGERAVANAARNLSYLRVGTSPPPADFRARVERARQQ